MFILNNTVIKYMKRFAGIMNFAEKIGLLEINPFKQFRFHIEKKFPIYLTMDEVDSAANENLMTSRLFKVRDAFNFSCWTGVTFGDICKFRKSNIEFRNGTFWLIVIRKKTDSISQISLLDEPLKTIGKYHPKFFDIGENCLLFDMCSNQKVNEYLKEIADLTTCGSE